jgi:hypothetical protein
MKTLITKLAAARSARRRRQAEQIQALWEERRRQARHHVPLAAFRFVFS